MRTVAVSIAGVGRTIKETLTVYNPAGIPFTRAVQIRYHHDAAVDNGNAHAGPNNSRLESHVGVDGFAGVIERAVYLPVGGNVLDVRIRGQILKFAGR